MRPQTTLITLFILAFFLLILNNSWAANIIPAPKKTTTLNGTTTLNSNSKIYYESPEFSEIANLLKEEIGRTHGINFSVSSGSSASIGDTGNEANKCNSTFGNYDVEYLGLREFHSFFDGVKLYDTWHSEGVVLQAPPNKIPQDVAKLWMQWYVEADRTIRENTLLDFNSVFRQNAPHLGLGAVKVLGVAKTCGLGCGSKRQAEIDPGLLDDMLSNPTDFTPQGQWTFIYEMSRGGVSEPYYNRGVWPQNSLFEPGLMAGITNHKLGGDEILESNDYFDKAISGLNSWEIAKTSYLEEFSHPTNKKPGSWSSEVLINGMLFRILQATNKETIKKILDILATKPESTSVDANTAMCDFAYAVNEVTNYQFASVLVHKWKLPDNCGWSVPPLVGDGGIRGAYKLDEGTYFIESTTTGERVGVECSGDNISMMGGEDVNRQKWEIIAENTGDYSIRNVYSGEYLEVMGKDCGNGINIRTYPLIQTWRIEQSGEDHSLLASHCNSHALDKGGDGNVHLWEYQQSNTNQQFKLILTSKGDGYNQGEPCDDGNPCTENDYIDDNCNCVSGNLLPNCNPNCTVGAPCDDGDPCTINDYLDINCDCVSDAVNPDCLSDDFSITNGTYFIESVATGKRASVNCYNDNVSMMEVDDINRQKWEIIAENTGGYSIRNVYSGEYLEVVGKACGNGINIRTYPLIQTWKIEQSGGNYFLVSSHCDSHAFDKGSDGHVHLWEYVQSNANQKFKLIPTSIGDTGNEANKCNSTFGNYDVEYLGLREFRSLFDGVKLYDTWHSEGVVLQAPPNKIPQDVAKLWMQWYVEADRTTRENTLLDFNSVFRQNAPHLGLGAVKVLGVAKTCGLGCGSKRQAEIDPELLDDMLSNPTDFTPLGQWTFIYEMSRGGIPEPYYNRGVWPQNSLFEPGLMAGITNHKLGGDEILESNDYFDKAISGLNSWEIAKTSYLEEFSHPTNKKPGSWSSEVLINGMLFRILQATNKETIKKILDILATKPESTSVDANTAMCDFAYAVNEVTNYQFASVLVHKWKLPDNCGWSVPPLVGDGGIRGAYKLDEGTYFIESTTTGERVGVECSGDNISMMGGEDVNRQKWEIIAENIGDYSIRNVYSGEYLEVMGKDCGNGINIRTYPLIQTWRIEQSGEDHSLLASHCNSHALDKGGDGNVHLWEYQQSNTNQQFKLILTSKGDGYNQGEPCDDGNPCTENDYIDDNCNCVSGNLLPNCNPNCTVGAPCDDGDPCTINDYLDINCDCVSDAVNPDCLSDDFSITNGTYFIESVATGKRASVNCYNDNVSMMEVDDINRQKWEIIAENTGGYSIRNVYSGEYLEVVGKACGNGINIRTYPLIQTWKIEQSGGNYFLVSSHCDSHAFDKGSDGHVHLWEYVQSNANQQFKLILTSKGDGYNQGEPCDDGNPCTENDYIDDNCNCVSGNLLPNCNPNCTVGAPCDDGDPCTINDYLDINCDCVSDAVNPDCLFDCPALEVNIGAPCDDGNPCTENDYIDDNCNCVSGNLLPNCNPNCTVGAPCDDGDPCTINDYLDINCDCVSDAINPDCLFDCPALEVNIGAPCDDGNPCTENDYIDDNCNCVSDNLLPNCNPNCTVGAPCDDGDPCTVSDYLDINCDCVSDAIKPDCLFDCPALEVNIGAPCDDGNPCTENDYIDDNCNCVSGNLLPNCNPNCTVGAPCDDGDPCTVSDYLDINCDCVSDAIKPDCLFDCPALEVNIGAPCDDGNPCTENDYIDDNCNCVSGNLLPNCNPNCTVGAPCDDGDPCTVSDYLDINCDCVSDAIKPDCLFDCPALEANIGDPCDDGDDNTENDIIQSDGCDCKGILKLEEPNLSIISCGTETSIAYGNGTIEMKGNPDKSYFFHVVNHQWQTIFNCGWRCGTTQSVSNLAPGKYYVFIRNRNWKIICYTTVVLLDKTADNDQDGILAEEDCNDNDANITKIGASCDDGNPNTSNDIMQEDCTCKGESTDNPITCGEVNITIEKGTITMQGNVDENYLFKINDINQGWRIAAYCIWRCGDSFVARNLPNSRYYITIYNRDWTKHCEMEIEINDSFTTSTSASARTNKLTSHLSLKAIQAGNQVELEWATTSGYKVDYFELERSSDGKEFTKIGSYTNKEWVANMSDYEVIDTELLRAANFYRLKEVYIDGSSKYTKIVQSLSNDEISAIEVYPNPADKIIYLRQNGRTVENGELTVVNQFGQIVKKIILSDNSKKIIEVATEDMPSGIYFIQLTSDRRKIFTKKLLIQRYF